MGARWTDDQREIVREIWRTPKTVAAQMHKLPGRTENAICREAEKLNIGAKTLAVRDEGALLAEAKAFIRKRINRNQHKTIKQIHLKSGIGVQRLRDAMKSMLDAKEAHVAEYVGPYHAASYAIGSSTNAVKPEPLTPEQIRANYELRRRAAGVGHATEEERAAKLDEKYRVRDFPWWPQADKTVSDAFRSMVDSGRQAA